jgi:decaprenylphospho-beta-D-erythro-pentofuranosid-2-ulose 2-reductase
MKPSILIIGATSGMAEALARRYASQGARFFLVARNESKLNQVASDLRARGAAQAEIFVMDANDLPTLPVMAEAAWGALGQVDLALVAHGSLPDQSKTQTDLHYAVQELRTNGESAIAVLTVLAQRFEAQRSGVLAVIGSVAGDRGRFSNHLYGAAKAAVDVFASGLRARLFHAGVHVLTIKPGFVATAMTAGLDLPQKLVATPEAVAELIERAVTRKKNVVYVPGFWRFIMLIIRHVPEFVFKRMKM